MVMVHSSVVVPSGGPAVVDSRATEIVAVFALPTFAFALALVLAMSRPLLVPFTIVFATCLAPVITVTISVAVMEIGIVPFPVGQCRAAQQAKHDSGPYDLLHDALQRNLSRGH
jgi:uncharacterized integral membrane protein